MTAQQSPGGLRLSGILPQPDPRSAIIYMILAGAIPLTYVSYQLAGMRLDGSWAWGVEIVAGLLILISWMLRRAGHSRISTFIETLTLMFLKGAFILILQYAVLTIPVPLADVWLLHADRLLHFDWLAFARASINLFSFPVLAFAYNSMGWQAILVLAALAATDRETRAWQLVTAAVIALAVTVAVFPLAPADGAFVLCGLQPPDIPVRAGLCEYRGIMHAIKDEGLRVITQSMATGMIAFPSFHTVASIVLTWGAWPIKTLRVPFLILNCLMLVATITVGGHYLVDVISGICIAALTLRIAGRLVRNQSEKTGSLREASPSAAPAV